MFPVVSLAKLVMNGVDDVFDRFVGYLTHHFLENSDVIECMREAREQEIYTQTAREQLRLAYGNKLQQRKRVLSPWIFKA